jgi:hypothetical protein
MRPIITLADGVIAVFNSFFEGLVVGVAIAI